MAKRQITQEDHDQVIEVHKGDLLTVQLPENPTTGYRWNLDQHDPALLDLQQTTFTPAGPGVGAGGGKQFVFVAKAPGMAEVLLNLRRHWEDKTAPTKSFKTRIHVTE